jgi:hypothetical protein
MRLTITSEPASQHTHKPLWISCLVLPCLVLSCRLFSCLALIWSLPPSRSFILRQENQATPLEGTTAATTSALLYGVTPVSPACSANVLGHLTLTSSLPPPSNAPQAFGDAALGLPAADPRESTRHQSCRMLDPPITLAPPPPAIQEATTVLQHWIPHPTTQYAACSAATLLLYSLEPRTDAGFRCGAFMTLHSHSIFPFPLHNSPPATTVLAWPSGWPHLYGSLARQIAVSSSATRAYQQPW